MTQVGFFTAAHLKGLYVDDLTAAQALERRGVSVTPVVWNAPFEAGAFDALVMRSPWDWYQHRVAFRDFLGALSTSPPPVFNSPAMLSRFADKTYFRHLEGLGLPVVPTAFFRPDELGGLPERLAQRGWSRAVLKPSFTANAYGARRFVAAEVAQVVREAQDHRVDSEWMLQPYLDAVESGGEWSLVFFDGEFSHAVLKRPKVGDYRVQPDHGGGSVLATPPADVLEVAAHIAQVAVADSLYARIDGVVHDGQFLLMELEVVEPELFFRLAPASADRFAEALQRRLAAR